VIAHVFYDYHLAIILNFPVLELWLIQLLDVAGVGVSFQSFDVLRIAEVA